MTKKDPDAMKECRDRMQCEHCHIRGQMQAHHVTARGMGGGSRMDVAKNLMACCNFCHSMITDGNISQQTVLEIVARREKVTVEALREYLWKLQRTPNRPIAGGSK